GASAGRGLVGFVDGSATGLPAGNGEARGKEGGRVGSFGGLPGLHAERASITRPGGGREGEGGDDENGKAQARRPTALKHRAPLVSRPGNGRWRDREPRRWRRLRSTSTAP